MIFLTSPGKTYSVNSVSGCTVSVGGTTLATIPANVQTTFIAPEEEVLVSDNNAIIVEVTGVGAGGSGGSGGIDTPSLKFEVVSALPDAGEDGIIYLVPTGETGDNKYEEWVWVNGSYEQMGAASLDLTGVALLDADNTFSAGNTFTGAVDMSGAQVTPPEGWNVADLTPEAIQAVVPMVWQANQKTKSYGTDSFVVGQDSAAGYHSVTVGTGCSNTNNSVVVGTGSIASSRNNQILLGRRVNGFATHLVAVGDVINAKGSASITVGAQFEDTAGTHPCTTEGTGSITIGAGANTLVGENQYGCDNSITIGCKANSATRDSITIGASAITKGTIGNITIGAGATNESYSAIAIGNKSISKNTCTVAMGDSASASGYCSISIGSNASSSGYNSHAIGQEATATGTNTFAVGRVANASAGYSIAIGSYAKAADYGAVVFRSTAEDGTYTQLYFSGANTPLANTYEGGEAMMGYVVRDSAGNVMTDAEGNAMVGTQKLSVLFPNNRGENAFTPAMLSLDEDWTPKPMFRPSDLDMPVEEPSEPEEYTPLPVYPIVEPEIEEIHSES